jgi:hypothetical protein
MTNRRTAQRYEVLGRLMSVLFDSGRPGIMTGADRFRFGENATGFYLDWTSGPHPHEVVAFVRDLAGSEDAATRIEQGDVTNAVLYPTTCPSRLPSFDLLGHKIMVRATRTVGHDCAVARHFAAAAAAIRQELSAS